MQLFQRELKVDLSHMEIDQEKRGGLIWTSSHNCSTFHPSLFVSFSKKTFYSILEYMAQRIKSLSAIHETWLRYLVWEREKGKGTHSSIITWRIPWTEEPGGLQTMWLQRV